MCGRFTLTLDPGDLQAEFDLVEVPADYHPRYNIAPSQPVAVVSDAASPRLEWMRWGLVPGWAKDLSIGNRMINARAETVQEKPAFRQAFARRRCLILADGFYEWQKLAGAGPSSPYYFQRLEGKPFAFAGLWDVWRSAEDDVIRSCTLITTTANAVVAPVHERMPVLLDRDASTAWLNPKTTDDKLQALLIPFPAAEMHAFPVSRAVNDPGREDPVCIQPEKS